ncbi:TonB-dependent receptor [Flavobacterium algicola]|uniref:TonB-dependent receptor n=1 Tax=Flavobacterium algicola TaxID=556529 RepID=UPI001EFE34F7|nr:TonB-dependent receptor [Flavobacterium algicola]MCG9792807.1 TonB-dependent receptor plug domain-containing protein [Flavobacterium algicola]
MFVKLTFISSVLLLLSMSSSSKCIAQQSNTIIKGIVMNNFGEPISNVKVGSTNSVEFSYTDASGNFIFETNSLKNQQLSFSLIGYRNKLVDTKITNSNKISLKIILERDIVEIDEVIVKNKSRSTKVKETSFAVNAIETKSFKNSTLDVNQLLNQSSGVRIKESGGMGSRYNFSLNGLSGKQVRFFVDGIPVDQLGSSFNFNNLAVNLVERVDVYKGVVPIDLGADALGGAINIVTDKAAKSYLDASYSIGSFNTHRAALISKYRFENSGFSTKLSGFYNYSDNNYRMSNMPIFKNGAETLVNIKRFHDNYESAMGALSIGFTKVTWADELMADIAVASVKQDVQNGIYGKPVGEATEKEINKTVSLKYSKSNLLNDKLRISLFGLYNEVNRISIDTSSNRYNWAGEIIRIENNNLGELVREKTIYDFDQKQYLYRANAKYDLNDNHELSFNHIYSNIDRVGANRLNTQNNEAFLSPNYLKKNVTAIAFTTNFFDDKLNTVLAVKYYQFHLLTKNAVEYLLGDFQIDDIETKQNKLGHALSSRYFITPNWLIKASFEKGYRIPQAEEIFGDGLRILANSLLKPETSHNVNVGFQHEFNSSAGIIKNEINFFQRDVDNFIFLQQEGVFSTYKNVLSVLVRGVEWDFNWTKRQLTVNGNLTWQNVLNNQKFVSGTTNESSVYRDRMPNTPYLFANVNALYVFENLISKTTLTANYGINYVHEYYLNYPSISITTNKNAIPSQFLNNLGLTFSSKNKKYNASLEMRNVFNMDAYDNFNLQKPGRFLSLKLRYLLSDSK